MKEKFLDLYLTVSESGEYTVEIYDPSTCDRSFYVLSYDETEHPEFNEWIGNEIYSWFEDMVGDDEK